ncbi:MAG: PHP domain-containing protein, partial [Saprospiraceae bacterium]|nr:PHP domain-containing protein [Saprospiraceae bacterium]
MTLKCDFHIHTVFSDGSVWPNIRVDEALKDGLDAISLTEHLEYQPHGEDIPHPDRNRSFEIAKEQAKAHDLLVIHGVEITRKLPPGHANAIFITDANALN